MRNPTRSRVSSFDVLRAAFLRLSPVHQMRNPVMFVVYAGAVLISADGLLRTDAMAGFTLIVAGLLWATVLFANVAEAYAEGHGKAQAATLRQTRGGATAKRLDDPDDLQSHRAVAAGALAVGDFVLLEPSDTVPTDGQVVKGVAALDESAVTGESCPVIRESGGDRDAVIAGTQVLSDWIVMRVTAQAGASQLDKMIAMVEGAKRQKTPSETALGILLTAFTIVFLISCATLWPFSAYMAAQQEASMGGAAPLDLAVLAALLVCLAPTTIGGLLSAIGIAGMNRLLRANVIATSGRAVEAAGDLNILLLDKTGTITLGNRQATAFIPAEGIVPMRLAQAALASSLADETPEGRSIVALAKTLYGLTQPTQTEDIVFIPFSADTRISGVQQGTTKILKGAGDAIEKIVRAASGAMPAALDKQIETIARQGGTPLVVAQDAEVLGLIHLKDIVKTGLKDRLASLRAMGIQSVMITGDNPLTAAAIAAEAGVDDFVAQAAPETKLEYIRREQSAGNLVGMVGDGTNDAPALAQADVAIAMNNGTQAAKEAANMVDMDSDPTKLIEVVEVGKQLLMTRGSLTTFSLANDVAKYFAIVPAVFTGTYPAFETLNIMHLSTPSNAILSALIFNALAILFLIPVAMRGVTYRPVGTNALLRHNLMSYGLGGLTFPFIGIKLIDMFLSFLKGIAHA